MFGSINQKTFNKGIKTMSSMSVPHSTTPNGSTLGATTDVPKEGDLLGKKISYCELFKFKMASTLFNKWESTLVKVLMVIPVIITAIGDVLKDIFGLALNVGIGLYNLSIRNHTVEAIAPPEDAEGFEGEEKTEEPVLTFTKKSDQKKYTEYQTLQGKTTKTKSDTKRIIKLAKDLKITAK